MQAVDAVFSLQLQRLESDLRSVYHTLNWPECEKLSSHTDFLTHCAQAGLPKRQAIMAMALALRLPMMSSSAPQIDTDGFYVNGGYYSHKNKILYLKNSVGSAIKDPVRYGVFFEDANDTNSQEPSVATTLTLSTLAQVVDDWMSRSGSYELLFKGGVVACVRGNKKTPMLAFDISALRTPYAHFYRKSSVSEMWAPVISAVESHINNSKAGRLIFLCGDHVFQGAEQQLQEKIRQRTAQFVSSEIKSGMQHVCVKSLDSLGREEATLALQEAKVNGGYLVLLSSAGNVTHLLERALTSFPVDALLLHWGTHHFRKTIPALCPHCRVASSSNTLLGDELLNTVEDVGNHFTKGPGCSFCFDGYRGVAVASEDLSDRAQFINRLLAVFKNTQQDDAKGEALLMHGKSFYAFPSEHYRSGGSNLLGSIRALVRSGDIQVADTHGLLI